MKGSGGVVGAHDKYVASLLCELHRLGGPPVTKVGMYGMYWDPNVVLIITQALHSLHGIIYIIHKEP